MIDFPASPTLNQIFLAPNGVTYQWNGTIWQSVSTGGTGQVQATNGTFVPATGADVVIIFGTVTNGNLGGWLNLTNGRYTPPAGSYFIQCTNGVQAPTGGNGTWTLAPRKNGVRIPSEGAQGSGSASFSIPLTVGVYVDANGTDYFDFVANCGSAGMAAQGGQFTAFPLTGIQGPSGPLPSALGDFCAYTGNVGLATGTAVGLPTTILSGNSGNWYNPANGRYTPPAGRYFIRASMWVTNTSAAVGLGVQIRKNGTPIPGPTGTAGNAGQVPGSAGWWGDPAQVVVVDANGSDYFDFTTYCGSGQTAMIQFMAFPIRGLIGPPGAAGPANPSNVLRNFLSGFVGSIPGSTQNMTWSLGSCADSTNSVWINSLGAITKSLATAWAPGSGASVGGRGTGVSLTANTWYFPFAIINGGNPDIYFDSVATGANAPPGTTAFRRLRPIKTDASSNILAALCKGDQVQWVAPITENYNTSLSLVSLIGVPSGIQVTWQGKFWGYNNATSWGVDFFTPGTALGTYVNSGSTGGQAGGQVQILTSLSAQIGTGQSGGLTSASLVTTGFIDQCGRYD